MAIFVYIQTQIQMDEVSAQTSYWLELKFVLVIDVLDDINSNKLRNGSNKFLLFYESLLSQTLSECCRARIVIII